MKPLCLAALAALLLLPRPARALDHDDDKKVGAQAPEKPKKETRQQRAEPAEKKGTQPGQVVGKVLRGAANIPVKTAAAIAKPITQLVDKCLHARSREEADHAAHEQLAQMSPQDREQLQRYAPQVLDGVRSRYAPAGTRRSPSSRPASLDDSLWNVRTAADDVAARADPSDMAKAGRVGVDYYQGGDSASARAWLERSLRGGYQSPDVLAAYGGIAYESKDPELAYRAATRALQLDPTNKPAQTLASMSEGRASQVHLPSALPDDEPTAAAAPGPEMTPASSAPDVQRSAELEATAARQAVVAPTNVELSAVRARDAETALRLGDFNDAYAKASEATTLDAQNAQAWNFRAMAASNLHRYSDAVHDASYAIGLAPKQAAPLVTRSWAYSQQGQYREGESDARAALEQAPNNAYAFHDLAFALAGEGERGQAVAALKQAADQDPRFKPKYDAALQLSGEGDMTLLFRDGPAQSPAPDAPAPRKRRFLTLLALSLIGGLLVALGLLQTVGEAWRTRVGRTLRRAATPAPSAGGLGDQYEVARKIGEGGMGVVFEARDKALDRRVAIKRMRQEIRSDAHERGRFIQEARAVAALNHTNVVSLYSIVEDDADVYLVFEYVDGVTLAEHLHRGPLSFSEARRIMRGVCAAVEHAHRQRIIHRDLKPSNIMLSREGQVKVMDFGVARQAKDAMTKRMLTNTIVGTPPYMAPEQEQGQVRPESDVFALGVMLYEMLTGRLPFQGLGAGMLLNKMNGKFAAATPLAPHPLPPGLEAVLAKALCADPDGRYRSPAELVAALDGLSVPAAA